MSDPWKQGVGNGADTGMASRLLLEALKGGGGLSSLLTLLSQAQAPLSEEQRGILELLHTLQNGDGDTADAAEPSRAAHAGRAECGRDDRDAGIEDAAETVADENELQALKQEIADLREVNDTAAAALGACPACWAVTPIAPFVAAMGRPVARRRIRASSMPWWSLPSGACTPHAKLGAILVRHAPDPTTRSERRPTDEWRELRQHGPRRIEHGVRAGRRGLRQRRGGRDARGDDGLGRG